MGLAQGQPGPEIDCCRSIEFVDSAGQLVHGYYALVDVSRAITRVAGFTEGCSGEFGFSSVNPITRPIYASGIPPALVINANYYTWPGGRDSNVYLHPCLRPRGWAVSNGQILVQPTEDDDGHYDSLAIYGTPKLGRYWEYIPKVSRNFNPAAAGVKEMISGKAIVRDGVNIAGIEDRLQWGAKRFRKLARTAIGAMPDGKRLVIVVIEGKQPGRSIGISLPGLAEFMQYQFGVTDAINLDGGGSSQLLYQESPGYGLFSWTSDAYPEGSNYHSTRATPIMLTFDWAAGARNTIQYSGLNLPGTGMPPSGTLCGKTISVQVSGSISFPIGSTARVELYSEQALVFVPGSAILVPRNPGADGTFVVQTGIKPEIVYCK
jgi:hypothetical protein